MKETVLYIFSASELAKLDVGSYAPALIKKHAFRPVVNEKYSTEVSGISLWQGDKYVHNVQDEKSKRSKGKIIGLKGPGTEMRLWEECLDEFEYSFGMEKEKRMIEIGESGREIPTIIYYLKEPRTKDDKDGKLKPLD